MHHPLVLDAFPTRQPTRTRSLRPRRYLLIAAALGLGAVLVFAHPGAAQDSCAQPGMNVQCTEFGTIAMESQRDIRGQRIDVSATITLNTAYADQGSRWQLFSVRNVETDGSNPVTISLTSFSTAYGDVVTTRVEHPTSNELNLWVDTLDTPVGTPITIRMEVGSTERGAYKLETLVMAFDRGYAPIQDSSGNDASLFSFTLLGVNKETAKDSSDLGGSLSDGNKLPGLGALPLVVALIVVAGLARRRLA